MLQKGIHSPWTTSAGRLFDAVASISGLRQRIKYEGQAAMELEFAIGAERTEQSYAFAISDGQDRIIVDWEAMIRAILNDVRGGISTARISRKFHNTLVEIILEVARRAGEKRVVLTGGCFQNKFLIEHAVQRLEQEGFRPYWHQRIPPNDGGIALGQIAAASRILRVSGPRSIAG
jgi:hydrogenase maturation protein HypF